MSIRFRSTAALVAALALTLAACGGGGDAAAPEAGELDLITPGTLTVCSDIPYEPFEFEDPSSPIGFSGFDIELIQAIAATGDLEVAVVVSGFDGLTSGATMAAGTCDLAISAMTITEERAQQIDFSEPYFDAVQSLLVPSGSAITGIGDLGAGVRVGVQSGTTGEAYATENAPEAEVTSFENEGDLTTALVAGSIDAILQDLDPNLQFTRDNAGFEVIETYDTDESYGIAFEKDRGDGLVAFVDAGLASVREDGTYDTIYQKYFGA
ncbi:MAG: Glutamine-binding periplasmic protein precursor [Actinomycetota bacterium]